jgi:hypothetical protein
LNFGCTNIGFSLFFSFSHPTKHSIIYPTEKESKSTALHAGVVCGKEQVK